MEDPNSGHRGQKVEENKKTKNKLTGNKRYCGTESDKIQIGIQARITAGKHE